TRPSSSLLGTRERASRCDRRLEKLLDHQHVLPLAVEGAVTLVHTDLPPAEVADHRDARLVLVEDFPDQLVSTRCSRSLCQPLEQAAARPRAPRTALNVES